MNDKCFCTALFALQVFEGSSINIILIYSSYMPDANDVFCIDYCKTEWTCSKLSKITTSTRSLTSDPSSERSTQKERKE